MNISAQGCTPIKPQAFGQKELSYDNVVSKTDKVNESLVSSGNLKGPLAVVASVALAGLVTYASGKKVANIVSTATKDKAGSAVMGALKKGSNAIEKSAKKLVETAGETKSAKIKQTVGKVIQTSSEVVKDGFEKFAYMGTSGIVEQKAKDAKALGNLLGAGAVVAMVPTICKRDQNKDGVADIAEKDQNAYTGSAYERSKHIAEEGAKKIGVIADLVETLM